MAFSDSLELGLLIMRSGILGVSLVVVLGIVQIFGAACLMTGPITFQFYFGFGGPISFAFGRVTQAVSFASRGLRNSQ